MTMMDVEGIMLRQIEEKKIPVILFTPGILKGKKKGRINKKLI